MKLKEDQKKLQDLLKETITLLIKSGLEFKNNFCVEALIGITLDDGDGFFLSIKDTVQALNTIANKGRGRSKSDLCDKEDDISYIDSDESEDSLVETTPGGTKRHSSSVNLRKRKSCQDHSSSQVSPSKQVKGQSRETTITNQVDEPLSNSSTYQLFGIRDESSNSVVKQEQPDNSTEEKDLVLIKTEATEPATDNYSFGVDTMSQTGYFSQEYSASERPNAITGTGMWNTGHHQIATGAFDSSGKPDVTGLQNGSQFQIVAQFQGKQEAFYSDKNPITNHGDPGVPVFYSTCHTSGQRELQKERARRYRQTIRQDPIKLAQFRMKETERKRRWRANQKLKPETENKDIKSSDNLLKKE